MIVATAGHIDHGKTALVKALTGVDTDRLPEEKRRGLSIDLGFAYRHDPDGGVLAFVDVPGHERFIRNMLAGVAGVDFALLAVAADDGPMPQTREHLAILDLLGLDAGAVALTKIDRVSPARIEEAATAARALLAGSALAQAPIFPVSAVTGEGIAALTDCLWAMARARPKRAPRGDFRLAVDRCFTLAGAGLVATGTVFAGRVRVGDRLVVSPAGAPVRVRGLHAHSRPAETAAAGDRCALNLTGTESRNAIIRRGDWIVAEAAHAPVERFDARLKVLAGEAAPLRHWTPVHVHLAAADVPGRVATLEGREIRPGAAALVQVVLEAPVGAAFGDRFVVRDRSARRTIGGGAVIDPFPPKRGRAQVARLAALEALALPDEAAALAALVALAPEGIDLESFARARNLTAAERAALGARAPFVAAAAKGRSRALDAARWRAWGEAVLAALAEAHAAAERPGLAVEALRGRTRGAVPAPLLEALLDGLIAEDRVVRMGALLYPAGCRPQAGAGDAALWEKARPLLAGAELKAPRANEVAATLGLPVPAAARFLDRMARKGRAVALGGGRYCEPGALVRLGRTVEALAADGAVTVARFRDASGIGRNLAIEVLEYFDRVGLTRRIGDAREIARPAAEVFRALGGVAEADKEEKGRETHPGGAHGLQIR